MTESVWWYVLAGFLLGFILSTLWEWLYFRRRRLRIENRRIAELEATVRSLTVTGSAGGAAPGVAPGYQGPGVFLENEGLQAGAETVATAYTPFAVYAATAEPTQSQPTAPQPTTFVAAERSAAATNEQSIPPDPVQPKSSQVEPARSEPVRSEPVRSEPVRSEPVQSEPVQPQSVRSESVQSDSVQSDSVRSEFVQSRSVQAEPVQPQPAPSEFVQSEPIQPASVQPAPPVQQLAPQSPPAQPVQPEPPAQPPPIVPVITRPPQPVQSPQPAAQQPVLAPAPPQPVQPAAPYQPVQQPQTQPITSPAPPMTPPAPPATGERLNGVVYVIREPEDTTAAVEEAIAVVEDAAVVATEREAAPAQALPTSVPSTSTPPTLSSFLPSAPKFASAASNGNHVQATNSSASALPVNDIQPGIQRVSGELDNLLVSLQGLIATTDPLLDNTADTDTAAGSAAPEPAVTGPYAARNLSRGEYAVVRFMQSARQFGRDLRSLYWGQ